MKKFIFLFLNLLTIIHVNAQVKLDGNIISAKTKLKPSEEIMIIVKETNEKAFTDSLGNFTLLKLDKNRRYSLELMSFLYGKVNMEFETQSDNQIIKTFEVLANCDFDSETAKREWKNKSAKLYLIGSIAPIANSKNDKKFEKKYNLKYFDFGCTPAPLECIIEYNKEVLKLIELEYGEEWKKEIRKDVVVD
ncbi:hypothetical protein [Flavobacterium sp.]|uniref:FEKKY domain-containing protein n=1 Tax=Flavobacterium sp. TaxID=239 RepID=UPI0025BBCC18|nr:hypothetical protein [Flavobacterium sp.]